MALVGRKFPNVTVDAISKSGENLRINVLEEAVKNNYILFFEHDPIIECCTLQQTEKGIRMKGSMKLKEI